MTSLLDILQVFLCVVLVFLILMHSGKDAGLSGAFGVGTGAGPFGGGSLVERNLNRWTIAFALAFVINTLVLILAGSWLSTDGRLPPGLARMFMRPAPATRP